MVKVVPIVLLAALVAVVGCGGKQGPSEQSPVAPVKETAQPEAPGATAPAATVPQYRIAVIPKGLVHQFWLTVKAGADAAGKELGAEILWNGPAKETEIDKQISIMEDMINLKVNAIVMAACDENALIPTVQKAADAGIPVITIDSGVKSETPITFVATDNIKGATMAAQELARLIGNAGKVGLIPFVPGAATSEMREKGFKEGIAAFPDITLASTLYSQSDVATGMAVTEDMMTAHADLRGIFGANESGAMGAAQAIEAAGKTGQVKLVAFDASNEEIAALKKGTIQALIVQNPFKMGYDGVKAAIDHLQGKPVEKRIDTGVTIVTQENLGSPEIQKLVKPLG